LFKEILVSIDEDETRIALLEDEQLIEYLVERKRERGIVGNIYKGKVKAILPGMQASFVEVGLERNAFLYVRDVAPDFSMFRTELDEELAGEDVANELDLDREAQNWRQSSIDDLLKVGQEITAQIVKEPMRKKGAKVSTHISLPGRLLVLTPTVEHLGISRRIENEAERKRLRELIESIRPPGMGFIVRTVGEGKDENAFRQDVDFLIGLWSRIQERSGKETAPSLIHEDLGMTFRAIRDFFTPDVDRLVIDSPEEYKRVMEYLENFLPNLKSRVSLYEKATPLFDKYGLAEEIEKSLHKKVRLKRGGYIVIEPTEALVTIDVNTGKFVGKTSLEETVFQTNMEAAAEIARQLRLRDLGGIIIIDFIDMTKEKNKAKVLEHLNECLKRDRSRSNILQITDLGLVEMTRKRVKQNVEMITSHNCPYCLGKGRVKSIETVTIEVLRALKGLVRSNLGEELLVKVYPEVADNLLEEYFNRLETLTGELEAQIHIKAVDDFHMECCEIISVLTQKVLYK